MSGFYLVHRGSMEHPVFAGDTFSRWQAWAWIIEAAAFKATKVAVNGKWVELGRGQFSHSFRFMAKAWRWDEAKVRRFIRRIEKENMIRCVTDAGQCVITVCNYDKYQTAGRVTDAAPDAPPTHHRRTTDANKNEVNQGKEDSDANASDAREAKAAIEADFREWYARFPNKKSPGTAARAYAAARKRADRETLLAGIERYIRDKPPDVNWCHPSTWLNGHRWLDEPAPLLQPRGNDRNESPRSTGKPSGHAAFIEAARNVIARETGFDPATGEPVGGQWPDDAPGQWTELPGGVDVSCHARRH